MEWENILAWLKENIFKYPNVIGYSMTLEPRERQGEVVSDEQCIRIFVTRKIPFTQLAEKYVVPWRLFDIPTDIVVRGEIRAPPQWVSTKKVKKLAVDKTAKFRPLELGISVGHMNITAGSLGMVYDHQGEEYVGSNAHVLTPDASLDSFVEKRILQPGAYHGGQAPDDVAGMCFWHKKVIPFGEYSDCEISNISTGLLNLLSKFFKRQTRFEAITQLTNNIDFAVFKPSVGTTLKVADDSINLDEVQFIGHLFAGSDISGIICKSKYIEAEGYKPKVPSAEVLPGDVVKGCSFWCNHQTTVLETSSVISVNYGNFIAVFEDVITVQNDGTIKGGWSGSGWFKL